LNYLCATCSTSQSLKPQRQFCFGQVLKRQTHSWVFGAILPSVILCMISYLGLYIARDNPGRPGVHCVTILAHFTLDSSMRTQIPHVGKNMWIDHFQTCATDSNSFDFGLRVLLATL
jgi:hypothetical protein